MYKMSAAHPTLPIPSYAKVTNLDNGNQVVVRINDRGPFHSTRVIDVSYTAALKLGLLGKGSHQLEVERILPADVDRFNAERSQQKAAAAAPPAPKPENKPKPLAPSEMAAMLYPAPPSGSAAAAVAPAPAQESVAPGPALASPGPQPLQAMPRAAPLILTPQAGAAMPVAVSQAAMTAPAAAGGFYLQLGAYGRKENAEAVRAKLVMDGALSGLEIVPSGDVHRLYAGPYATRQEAAQAIPALPSAMGLKPLIIQR
jgi:rare lipoprotein A